MIKVAIVNVYFAPLLIGGATRVVMDNVDVMLRDYGDELQPVAFTATPASESAYTVSVYPYSAMRTYSVETPLRPHMDWIPRDETTGDRFRDFLEFERPDVVHFHCIQRLTGTIVGRSLPAAAFDTLKSPFGLALVLGLAAITALIALATRSARRGDAGGPS